LLAGYEFFVPAIETGSTVAVDDAVSIMWQLVRTRHTVRAVVTSSGFTLLDELAVIQQQVSFETVILQGHPVLVCLNEFTTLIHISGGFGFVTAVDARLVRSWLSWSKDVVDCLREYDS
jgi:hypothetical protein